ncbi:MAG: LptF/LptG family permease [Hydrogenothermaceae bacterium]|nr:LptF/LptG family permease [Hydrogenothermaceae bacterium]
MKILQRYILTKTLAYFFVLLPAFTITSILIESIEIFRKVKVINFELISLYLISKIPENAYYIIPLSILVSIFLVIKDIKKNREIYPILLNGISLLYLSFIFIMISGLITIIQIFNSEYIMPKTVPLSQNFYLKLKDVKEESQKTVAYSIWLRVKENSFLYFDFLDFRTKTGKGLIYLEFDKDLKPIKELELEEFKIEGNRIYGEKGKFVSIPSLDSVDIKSIDSYKDTSIEIDQEELKKLIKQKKPVSISEFYKIAKISQKYGYESSYFWSKFMQKVTTVISPLILVIFAISFFWKSSYKQIFIGFLGVLFYWYSIAILSSISEAGNIHYSFIASIDIIFLVVGLISLAQINRDLEI